jgi:L-fuculose-phosphate aldolase
MSRRRAIVDACLEMNRRGINQGMSGNISVRGGKGCLVTPSGVAYDALKPTDIVEMDLRGNWSGTLKPSSEWRLHVDIYRTFEAARAVVHAHPPHATALACLRRPIPAFHYMVAVAGGRDIRCAEYATFGTAELSQRMLRALEGRTACLLANHGIVCFGDSLERALWRAEEVESLARQYLLALSVGDPVMLDDAQMDEVIDLFRSYGRQSSD